MNMIEFVQRMYVYIYIESRKLKVHEKDMNKFGKVPSLTTCLYKNDVWHVLGSIA